MLRALVRYARLSLRIHAAREEQSAFDRWARPWTTLFFAALLLSYGGLVLLVLWPLDLIALDDPAQRAAFAWLRLGNASACALALLGLTTRVARRHVERYAGLTLLVITVLGATLASALPHDPFYWPGMLAPLATAMLLVPLPHRAAWAIAIGLAHNLAWHARAPAAALLDPRTPATLGIYATAIVLALALGHALYLFAWRVFRDRRELAGFNTKLEDEVRRLARRVERLHEDERTRLASDLHDELGQSLTALRLEVALLPKRGQQPAADALNAHLDELFESVRWLVSSLSPRALEERGLTAACEWLVDRFRMRTRLAIHARIDEPPPALGPSERLTVFRVLQEALTNVARHAEAQRVDVALACSDERVELSIADDGTGFDPAADTEGHGLWAMRERARAIGAELAIDARARGTRVVLSIPIAATEAA